jgi:DNA-binding response OmpR family regulator
MRVLIVEDDLNLLRLYEKTLSHADHQVTMAATIGAAQKLLAKHTYDVTLLDITVGRMNSFDLLRHFPGLAGQAGRILIISGDEDHREYCETLGLEFYRKPLAGRSLLEVVAATSAAC